MKRLIKPGAIILGISCLLFAGGSLSAKEVKVKGVGVAPITRDQVSARRAALVLAKRDAVERALGAEVRAEAIPAQELERVVAQSSGRLKFSVASEGAQGKVYVTEIEAAVEVPEEFLAKYPKSVEEEQTGYQALVQKFPHGEVNWRDGYLLARGAARLKSTDEKARAEAKRAAQVDAYGLALQMLGGINFDPEETVGKRLQKKPEIEYRLQGLIQGAELIDEKKPDPDTLQVTIKVPLRGIRGVERALTERMNLKEPAPTPPLEKADEEKTYTGIIVDARGLKALPALFPEIVDENGNPVYALDLIDPAALAERGAAAYVTGAEEPMPGPKGANLETPRFLVVPALAVTSTRQVAVAVEDFGGAGAPSTRLLKTWRILAQAAATKIILRQGPKPQKVTAVKSAGPTRSRIVISNTSAGQVREALGSNNFFRQARTVIITDSMIGGTEGKYWKPRPVLPAAR